ncbi:alpha-hydroxy-acid oxidizing protein [Halalkalibacter wakoensis]|nr:alpha-hydroxy-acid oxidizing protein [Halalkalibacter wakoensis]
MSSNVGFRSPEEWERLAKERLEQGPFEYIQSGSGAEETLEANLAGLRNWKIVPRVLRDVSTLDVQSTIIGVQSNLPVALAPVGFQTIIHPEGELAAARAAAAKGIPYTVSTVSSYSMEQIAEVMGKGARFFQLYWPNDDEIALSFVKRAEKSGYSAILITVDTPLLGLREQDKQNQYFPLKNGHGLGNYESDPVFRTKANLETKEKSEVISEVASRLFNPTLTWEKVRWLRTQTKLPIVIKGIVHPDDARLAVENGIDGVVVSNHGGRQLDGSISSMDALEDMVKAVKGDIPIIFDGGIRRGVDIVKALALGADSVLIGRLYAYALIDGQVGVEKAITQLKDEFQTALALTGETKLIDLKKTMLLKR